MSTNKEEYSFFAGRLSDEQVESGEENHSLYEFDDDLFQNEVNFSAFGDDCALRGTGVLTDNPKLVLRVNLDEDKEFIKKAQKSRENLINSFHSVVICHVRVVSNRHKYTSKDGQQHVYKEYGYVPILANSTTAKKMLLKFSAGDHIEFRGAFVSKQQKDKDGNLTNYISYYCLLRQFSGYPMQEKKRKLEKALGLSKEVEQEKQPKRNSKNEMSSNQGEKKSAEPRSHAYAQNVNDYFKGGDNLQKGKTIHTEVKSDLTDTSSTDVLKKYRTRAEYKAHRTSSQTSDVPIDIQEESVSNKSEPQESSMTSTANADEHVENDSKSVSTENVVSSNGSTELNFNF